jgi:hypothetical protein
VRAARIGRTADPLAIRMAPTSLLGAALGSRAALDHAPKLAASLRDLRLAPALRAPPRAAARRAAGAAAAAAAVQAPPRPGGPKAGEGHSALLSGLGSVGGVGDVPPALMPGLLRLAHVKSRVSLAGKK